MMPIKDNQDVACFAVTKHSWKGKYKRIFSIGNLGITTYHPISLEVTNRWAYNDFISVQLVQKKTNSVYNEFSITMKKDRKIDTMTFSTDHRAHLMTEAFKYRHLFAEKPKDVYRYEAYKMHWSDTRLPVMLEITPYSIDQLDPATNHVLASYCFKDLEGIASISNLHGGFAIISGGFGRQHLFQSSNREDIKQKTKEMALNNLGIVVKVLQETTTLEECQLRRFGEFRDDEHITSSSEFSVHKIHSARHTEPQRRTLCLSETCLLERDPQTYSICTLRPLNNVFALIRNDDDPQSFAIEYVNGQTRTYSTTDRDSLLASLLDGVRGSGNRDVYVTAGPIHKGYRLGPLHLPVDEETESTHVKFLSNPPARHSFIETVYRLNANVPYSGLLYSVTQEGLFAENKNKLIMGALQSLVQNEGDQTSTSGRDIEAQFHALRRLVASKVGFSAFTMLPGFREAVGLKVVNALKRSDYGVTHAAVDMVCALMHPMHDDYDLRQEQLNKSSLLQTKVFLENLLEMWVGHVNHGTGALVVSSMLDLLTFALCVPYSETTDGKHFDMLLEMVASRGRTVFKLFQHPSLAVVKGAGLVMRALIEEGDAEAAAAMQNLALAEGALPRHLLSSLYSFGSDGRLLAHRQLSRHLVGLWITGNPVAMGLLKRILPTGLLNFLDSNDRVPDEALEQEMLNNRDNLKMAQEHANRHRRNENWIAVEKQLKNLQKRIEQYTDLAVQHWGTRMGAAMGDRKDKTVKERPIVLRKRRERIKAEANWKLFYWNFNRDHALPNLIWNHKTREELRCALENEIRAFSSDRELAGGALVSWNHREFELHYHSLSDEVRIGDYYLRLLLESDDANSPIRRSYEFFNDLYHRFLLTNKVEMRCMCLQAMSIVYGRYFEDIGPFADTKYVVGMLERCVDRCERDRLLVFVGKLVLHERNVKDVIEVNGVKTLVDLITLAHLHTSRAVVPTQTNVIEAAPDARTAAATEKEWYLNDDKNERRGPLSFDEVKEAYRRGELTPRTKCWAMGLDGWRTAAQIPQLKWGLIARGSPVMNESELASLALDVLTRMCAYYPGRDGDGAIVRPFPRVKRALTDPSCLPHVVQLLLTFDPVLVEKVAALLCEIASDNPEASKIYLTGAFFFILMYTGSNVHPIARFLQLTHSKQAFRSDDAPTSDIMQRSILGRLLPEAMVYYLENHGAEKFAQIFLGEFDTPEAIWNAEMRRTLIEKVAAHIADFSPRLQSHTMARYQYIAIPAVRYPQLEKELFCNIFYLKHLCDSTRFPDWPIADPVALLRDVLDAWNREIDKKPPAMTVQQAYATLGLKADANPDEAIVRKAYYRLAQQFHPDKNPEGRERFEQVNQAYEFLCSRSCWSGDGPNPDNIVLVLRTQSILFERYAEQLQPYKYAGYPQLIKTIRLETSDEQLFSKSAPLLVAATELCYRTVHCSALNAEELRRENGLEVLSDAYSRCVSVLGESSKVGDVAVAVCQNVTRCYAVAARFSGCRERTVELPSVVADLCRVMHFKHLTRLCSAATECVAALSADAALQMQLLQYGALWNLLLFMFDYDYTLDEGGVDRTEEANRQEVANGLAKSAVGACAKLGGYSGETPHNPVTVAALDALLTRYLARLLAIDVPEKLLKALTSNCETPYLVWDNGTRAELVEYLERQRKARHFAEEADPAFGADFVFSAHVGELRIGDVFVRVYNEQPTFQLANPKGFAAELLDFVSQRYDRIRNLENVALSVTIKDVLNHSRMALRALYNVIKNNNGVEIQCIGFFRLLFGLLTVACPEALQTEALDVLSLVTKNEECVNDIASTEVLGHILLALRSLPDRQISALQIIYALISTTKIVKEALNKGAVIYLLDSFCNSNNQQLREYCAEILAKMTADKLIGPKIRLVLGKFLPPVFADAMRDSPQTCVHMFETTHEHPELIWNQDAKDRVCTAVSHMRQEHQAVQMHNPSAAWKIPDNNGLGNIVDPNEIVVGGVYLRLFVANPGWTLRKPREFLSELMETCLSLMVKDKMEENKLDVCTTALCALLQAQPSLSDLVPTLGHIPRLCKQMGSNNDQPAVPKAAILIVHQLASSEVCINAFSQTDCMYPLKQAMLVRRDMIGVACEALNRLFSTNQEFLVKQALDADLVTYLLKLLEGQLENLENPSMTKAQIVKALKSMTRSLHYGDKVTAILEKSTIWADYRDQKHDLFISSTPISGYLTAGTPSAAGYLTQSTNKTVTVAPPPVDKEDLPHRDLL